MSKRLKIVLAFLGFFITLSVDAFAADIGCEQPAYDASVKGNGCNPYAGTDPGGAGPGGGSLSADEVLADQRCRGSQEAGIAGCKSTGGTTAQITSCENKVDTAELKCIKQAEATYGQGGATATGNTSDPSNSAAAIAAKRNNESKEAPIK